MPKVLQITGYSPSDIGIIFASAPLVRFLVPFLFLKYISFTQNTFKSALLLTFITSLFFYITLDSFWALLITNIFLGIGMSLSAPYVDSFALSHMPKSMYGKVRLFGSVGFILVSLVLVNHLEPVTNALIYLSISSFITLFFGLFILSYENKLNITETIQTQEFSILKHWPLWLSLFLMQMAFGAFYNFFTIYASSYDIGIQSLNISSLDMTIYLWSFGVICEIVMLYFQAPLLKNNLLKVLQFAVAVTVFRWVLLSIFPENINILFFSQSLHAFSFALYHSAAIMYLHSIYENKKLSQQFFAGIAYGAGGFIGAISSGYIYEISPKGLYMAAAFITLASFIFLTVETKRTIA